MARYQLIVYTNSGVVPTIDAISVSGEATTVDELTLFNTNSQGYDAWVVRTANTSLNANFQTITSTITTSDGSNLATERTLSSTGIDLSESSGSTATTPSINPYDMIGVPVEEESSAANLKLFVHNADTGACELAGLLPYPVVTTEDADVTITTVTDPDTGQVSYDIAVDTAVDVNVDNFSYDSDAKTIILTETDGTVHTIDVSELMDNVTSTVTQVVTGNEIATHDDGAGNVTSIQETVTSLAADGGALVFTAEDGAETTISICELMAAIPDNGLVLGS